MIEVDREFLGTVKIDVFTLFPHWFDWFSDAAPRAQRARAGPRARLRRPARDHAAEGRARWTTRRTAAGPGW